MKLTKQCLFLLCVIQSVLLHSILIHFLNVRVIHSLILEPQVSKHTSSKNSAPENILIYIFLHKGGRMFIIASFVTRNSKQHESHQWKNGKIGGIFIQWNII